MVDVDIICSILPPKKHYPDFVLLKFFIQNCINQILFRSTLSRGRANFIMNIRTTPLIHVYTLMVYSLTITKDEGPGNSQWLMLVFSSILLSKINNTILFFVSLNSSPNDNKSSLQFNILSALRLNVQPAFQVFIHDRTTITHRLCYHHFFHRKRRYFFSFFFRR